MKNHNAVLYISVQALLVLVTFAVAGAFQAEVLNSEVNPGDAFLIKVKEVKTLQPLSAVLNNKPFYFSSCGQGCFIAVGAVGIETKPGVYTIQLSAGEKKKKLDLVVRHAGFPEITLTLPDKKVFPGPEDLKRAQREDAKLKALWQKVSERLWKGRFVLPLDNAISTQFGTKRIINKKKISVHRGMDIRGKKGEKVKASNRGRVVLSEELFFGGNTIVIDHGQGIYTIYMHLSEIQVKLDDIVAKGDSIGLVGSSGRATGPHLHLGVKVLNVNTNPVSFFELDL